MGTVVLGLGLEIIWSLRCSRRGKLEPLSNLCLYLREVQLIVINFFLSWVYVELLIFIYTETLR